MSTVAVSPYLLVEDVAERLRCSARTIHELTRTRAIPHRRLPGGRRCLFLLDELEAWEAGAPLEVIEIPRGGRVVQPKTAARSRLRDDGRRQVERASGAGADGEPASQA